jgi:hypothetical protein
MGNPHYFWKSKWSSHFCNIVVFVELLFLFKQNLAVRHIWVCQHLVYLSPERIASHLHPHGHQDASLVPGRRQESGAFWNPCLPIFAVPQQVHLQLAMIMHNDLEVI